MSATTVGVVGAGSWGTTLAKLLVEAGSQVLLWARRPELCAEINEQRVNGRYLPDHPLPEGLEATTDLERVCTGCHLLFLIVPSHGLREVAYRMGEHLVGEQVLIHGTKGIEQGTFQRMSDVLREETCVRKLGVLSGPNLARELASGRPGGTLVASPYDEAVELCQQALNGPTFKVYGGGDVVGAEVGGAFKNIIALAAGAVDGLELGDNTKALLLTRGLHEMARYGASLGAQPATFFGMAGIGDLMATCASPLSRNHQVGERLARGETLEHIQETMFMVAEGVKTARSVHEDATARGLDLPIASAVYRVVHEGLPVGDALRTLMERPTGREFKGLDL